MIVQAGYIETLDSTVQNPAAVPAVIALLELAVAMKAERIPPAGAAIAPAVLLSEVERAQTSAAALEAAETLSPKVSANIYVAVVDAELATAGVHFAAVAVGFAAGTWAVHLAGLVLAKVGQPVRAASS